MSDTLLAPEKEKTAEPVIDKSIDIELPDFKVSKIRTSVWTTKMKLWLATQDAIIVFASLMLSFQLRFGKFIYDSSNYPIKTYAYLILVSLPFWLAINYFSKLYDDKNLLVGNEEYRRVIHSAALGIISVMAISSWLKMDLARGWLVISWASSTLLLVYARYTYRKLLHRRLSHTELGVNLVVVGVNDEAIHLVETINSCRYLGFRTVGLIGDLNSNFSLDYQVIGGYKELSQIVDRYGIGAAIIVPSAIPQNLFQPLSKLLSKKGVATYVHPSLKEIISSRVNIQPVGGIPLISLEIRKFEGIKLFIKRLLDITGATFLLLIFSPVVLALAVLIKFESQGPIFFKQKRVGENGRLFDMFKFRSMFNNADEIKKGLMHLNEVDGPIFKIKDDPRITKIGKFMRRWSLDELPQLFNVLKGDMSIVGPRPLPKSEAEKCDDWEAQRCDALPGITGLWQINGRSDLSFSEMIKFDLFYIENWSPTMDIYILIRTIPTILGGKGAY
jgi:exopolysaccharide biosynthesis polyprenyl glycosylphosphotransferase